MNKKGLSSLFNIILKIMSNSLHNYGKFFNLLILLPSFKSYKVMLKKIETQKAPKAIGPYSQAILANNFLFISGQLPLNPTSGTLITGDIRKQVIRILDNLEAILHAANSSFEFVVRVEIFLLDLKNFPAVNEEYAKRFTSSTPPARQTIQVARLPLDAEIEISCIALIK